MGQQCSRDSGVDETVSDRKKSRKSIKYGENSKAEAKGSGKAKGSRISQFADNGAVSSEDESKITPSAPREEWINASTGSNSEIIGLSHRIMPRPLLIDKSLLAKDFREYSNRTFGGQDHAFLSVASAHTMEDGKGRNAVLCVGEGKDISLLNFETGHILSRWTRAHSKDINVVTRPCAADASAFYTGSRDCTVKGWRVGEPSQTILFQGHTLNVTAVDPHPQGGRLATGSRDNTVKLWDTSNGECIASQDVKLNLVHFVKWIPGMPCVFAQGGEDLTVRLWDTREERNSLSVVNTLANFDYHPICGEMVSSADGGSDFTLYTGHNGFNGAGSMITEWDLRMGTQVRHYRGHTLTIRAVHKLRNGPNKGCLVSIGDDNTLKLWKAGELHEGSLSENEKPIASVTIPEGRPSAIDESVDGKLFVSLRSGCVLVFSPIDLTRLGERYRYLGSPFIE